MAVDWTRVMHRAAELKDQGYTDEQVSAVLDQEAAAADHTAQQYGHQNAQTARGALQSQRGALNADAAPVGSVPDEDPISRGFAAADESGYQRGSDQRMEAFTSALFEAARAGDPRVMTTGVVDQETRERWHEDSKRRQIANRERSGMRRR